MPVRFEQPQPFNPYLAAAHAARQRQIEEEERRQRQMELQARMANAAANRQADLANAHLRQQAMLGRQQPQMQPPQPQMPLPIVGPPADAKGGMPLPAEVKGGPGPDVEARGGAPPSVDFKGGPPPEMAPEVPWHPSGWFSQTPEPPPQPMPPGVVLAPVGMPPPERSGSSGPPPPMPPPPPMQPGVPAPVMNRLPPPQGQRPGMPPPPNAIPQRPGPQPKALVPPPQRPPTPPQQPPGGRVGFAPPFAPGMGPPPLAQRQQMEQARQQQEEQRPLSQADKVRIQKLQSGISYYDGLKAAGRFGQGPYAEQQYQRAVGPIMQELGPLMKRKENDEKRQQEKQAEQLKQQAMMMGAAKVADEITQNKEMSDWINKNPRMEKNPVTGEMEPHYWNPKTQKFEPREWDELTKQRIAAKEAERKAQEKARADEQEAQRKEQKEAQEAQRKAQEKQEQDFHKRWTDTQKRLTVPEVKKKTDAAGNVLEPGSHEVPPTAGAILKAIQDEDEARAVYLGRQKVDASAQAVREAKRKRDEAAGDEWVKADQALMDALNKHAEVHREYSQIETQWAPPREAAAAPSAPQAGKTDEERFAERMKGLMFGPS